VMNMEQDVIIMQEVFRYKQLGIDQNGRCYGQFEASKSRRALRSLEKLR
jgi:pilus assembly protein CpaF